MDVLTVSGLTFNVKTTQPEDVDLVENTGEKILSSHSQLFLVATFTFDFAMKPSFFAQK